MNRVLVLAFVSFLCSSPLWAQIPSGGFTYTHLAANASTVVRSSGGILYAVTINTKGASSNVLTIYDNGTTCSGTVIAAVDTTSNIGTLTYNVATKNGICVTLGTGTSADVTVAWQ